MKVDLILSYTETKDKGLQKHLQRIQHVTKFSEILMTEKMVTKF